MKDIISLTNFYMTPYLTQFVAETGENFILGAKLSEDCLVLLNENFENIKKIYVVDYSKFIQYFWKNYYNDFKITKNNNFFLFMMPNVKFEFPILASFNKEEYFGNFPELDSEYVRINHEFFLVMLYFFNRYYLNPVSFVSIYSASSFILYISDLVFLDVEVEGFKFDFNFSLPYYLVSYILEYCLVNLYPRNKNIVTHYKRKKIDFSSQIIEFMNKEDLYIFRLNEYTKIYYRNVKKRDLSKIESNSDLLAIIDFNNFIEFLKQNITKPRATKFLDIILKNGSVYLRLDLPKYKLEEKLEDSHSFKDLKISVSFNILLLFFNNNNTKKKIYLYKSDNYLNFTFTFKNYYYYKVNVFVRC